MNLNDLLTLVKELTEPEVSEQVIKIIEGAADAYVGPLCRVIAGSCDQLYKELKAVGFNHEDTMSIVVALANKGKGGS